LTTTGVTDSGGRTSFTYTSPTAGTDVVRASFVSGGTTQSSNDATQVWTASTADTTAPTCTVTRLITGPPKQQQVTVVDNGSGLASITNVNAINGTVSVPSFTPGTKSIVITATKTDQSKRTFLDQTQCLLFPATSVASNSQVTAARSVVGA